jgi:hypothetical protein
VSDIVSIAEFCDFIIPKVASAVSHEHAGDGIVKEYSFQSVNG